MAHILLLEDDPILGKALQLNLEIAGYEVLLCPDLRTARLLVAESSFDLFLLDWNLPDGTGFELYNSLVGAGGAVPTIFMTAKIDEETAVLALAAGAHDFMRKPFGEAELLIRIKKTLGEAVSDERPIRFGDLLVFSKQNRAAFQKTELILSPSEFTILAFLVKRGDSPSSREELLNALDPDGNAFDRTVDSHLSHLRQKLKAAKVTAIEISSVYGLGYKLVKK